MTTEHKPHISPGIAGLREYAERSKTWGAGEKTEDELLQRIWNLAGDVTGLLEQLEAAHRELELRASAGVWREAHARADDLQEQLEAAQAEIERLRDFYGVSIPAKRPT